MKNLKGARWMVVVLILVTGIIVAMTGLPLAVAGAQAQEVVKAPEPAPQEEKKTEFSMPTLVLEARAYPLRGPLDKREPEVLDFRYAPRHWQTLIGLPDDPHKSLVLQDGEYVPNGPGCPGLRATVEAGGGAGKVRQHLLDPRIPVVVTEQRIGDLVLRQESWAGAPDGKSVEEWSGRRLDFLWLKLKNEGTQAVAGRIVVGGKDRAVGIAADGKSLLGAGGKVVATISPACEAPPRHQVAITPDHLPAISHNWAKPYASPLTLNVEFQQ